MPFFTLMPSCSVLPDAHLGGVHKFCMRQADFLSSILGKALAVSNIQAVPMHRLKRAVPVFVMRLLLRR